MNLYLFNTIMNTIWYIFTMLFVLYKYTTFFSYLYNFTDFTRRIFSVVVYVISKIAEYINKNKKDYIHINNTNDIPIQQFRYSEIPITDIDLETGNVIKNKKPNKSWMTLFKKGESDEEIFLDEHNFDRDSEIIEDDDIIFSADNFSDKQNNSSEIQNPPFAFIDLDQ